MKQELKSSKLCKDCDKPTYSVTIASKNNYGTVYLKNPKHYNQCKECRTKTQKSILRRYKAGRGIWAIYNQVYSSFPQEIKKRKVKI